MKPAKRPLRTEQALSLGPDLRGTRNEVPLQVMVPQGVRRQVALLSAERGENIRTIVLRGLRAVGVEVPEAELGDRRGRKQKEK